MTTSTRTAPPPRPGRTARLRPGTPLERGHLAILVALAALTVGAWVELGPISSNSARQMGAHQHS